MIYKILVRTLIIGSSSGGSDIDTVVLEFRDKLTAEKVYERLHSQSLPTVYTYQMITKLY